MTDHEIRRLDPEGVRAAADGLAEVLVDCVEGGASVSFMRGLDTARARAFWLDVADQAERDGRAVFAALHGGQVVGTVQMIPAGYENQPHRADIAKMLVVRSARRRGIGAALMRAAEAAAAAAGKTVLTLDTASGDAERLYAALGWVQVGRIPSFALMPDGSPCDTTIFYRLLPAR